MKRMMVLVIGTAVGALFACSSGSTGGTTGDGGTIEGGSSGSSGGGNTSIDLTGLDTTCTTTADCVTVVAGDACAICQCANQVIAKKAQAAYDAKLAAARNACGPRPAIACAADCAQVAFSCSAAGKCVLGITADGG